MTQLRVAIVDDEAHARERLRRLLEPDQSIEIVAECASGTEAVATARKLRPDLMLLDIQMPELDGFDVIEAIPADELPLFVFVTAFDEYALQAFEIHAVDYLLKPIEGPRLFEAISRARSRANQGRIARPMAGGDQSGLERAAEPLVATEGAPQISERLLVRQDGQLYPIRARDIIYVEAHGNYAKLHLADRAFTIRETMTNIEARLDPERFARIHRSVIVNLDAIREMQPWFGGDYVAILKNGVRLKASRVYKSRLHKWTLG